MENLSKGEKEKIEIEQRFEISKMEEEFKYKHLECLREIRHKQELLFDRYLFLLTTGALSASIYIKYFQETPEYLCFLISSWIFLCISLIISLISFIVSINVFKEAEENLINNKVYKGKNHIDFLRYSLFLFFVIGIIFLLVFYSLNFINMSEKNNSSKKEPIVTKPIGDYRGNSCGEPSSEYKPNLKPTVDNKNIKK